VASPVKTSNKGWRFMLGIAAAAMACAVASGFTFILNDTTSLPVKWPAGSIPIRIMLGTTQNLSDGTSFNSSAAAAAGLWNDQIGAVQFVATQAAPGPAGETNALNELVFASDVFGRKFDENVLAITTTSYSGNERRAGDIVFNTAYTWNSYRGSRQGQTIDLRRVALHELGHLLGLDHPDEAGQSVSAVMNSKVGNLDNLVADDISGAQAIYGPPGVPANDNFANATEISLASGSLALTGYNTNATKQPGEPNHAGNAGGRSVWWRWRPTNPGDVTIDTKGSYYDTALAVYSGTSLSGLTPIAADDDIQDGIVQASTVSFHVNGNTTYMIAVDGFNGDRTGADNGGIKLNLTYAPSSSDGLVITAQPQSVTVNSGGSATFSVTVTGAAPISYQWYFNNTAISGATSASYALSNIQSAQAGNYTVTASNSVSNVTSSAAALSVTTSAPPAPSSGGGGGGGGGGAPSLWFFAALAALGLSRLRRRR